ncbi:DNA-directed RNA polymerase III subunit RPC6-like [Artemia franciscana]|uniref:DNA-directed RNA polymerase III subunit RPC6 n=1 Tax=Artemia franciscana TaxID=6661 RepID=A0AA88HVE0_ARTSF|nr:hypothetical protein QYM36_010421 [Artemia franciscana]KAK2715848.1 hypothetical protein QYM36_010421 [Artemia franciscana]
MTSSSFVVKKEKLDPSELDKILLDFCKAHPEGVSGPLLKSSHPDLDLKQCTIRLQKLVSEGKLAIFKKGATNLFKYKELSAAQKNVKFENEIEKAIYDVIADSGKIGIWIKDLRESIGVAQQQCITALKSLKAKELVKEVFPGTGHKRMWMLYDIEPDQQYIADKGGPWVNESTGEFEPDVGEKLMNLTLAYLKKQFNRPSDNSGLFAERKRHYLTPAEIHKFLEEKKIIDAKTTVEHVETVCDNLVFERSVVKKVSSNGPVYRFAKAMMESSGFSSVPCGFCPLTEECRVDAVVSPQSCEYYSKWKETAETADMLVEPLKSVRPLV